ncbi:unnamed protein product [Schistosoma turkestanicum]|nr:unnamed protein product [Schistosoma turkestanicum]
MDHMLIWYQNNHFIDYTATVSSFQHDESFVSSTSNLNRTTVISFREAVIVIGLTCIFIGLNLALFISLSQSTHSLSRWIKLIIISSMLLTCIDFVLLKSFFKLQYTIISAFSTFVVTLVGIIFGLRIPSLTEQSKAILLIFSGVLTLLGMILMILSLYYVCFNFRDIEKYYYL